ncbi:outer membrane beta-barrel protein [Chitinophaga arvensicola]|uniref:Outer membrane receptor proteins, mostly Fe transport n=1 Tax=Chitinophaga arvensicola TaxID=29529 RepID=A0A1I0SD99_9BACT|nr:outer membrane beta-barrel protein [Chitinophaga arvensicola]SEW53928.1 Outer membrane receptor proteins, mostly Fe transport [Chitinophaga arvensicola]
MKHLLILLLIALFTLELDAQSSHLMKIKGSIHDEEMNASLANASIICLYAKDSSRIKLGFTDQNGHFFFDSLPRQNLILYITYMGYQPLIHNVKTQANVEAIDVGIIPMKRTGISLAEVEILQETPIVKIIKDTIEFNANHFKTKNNASVEDLFKKIPGIQIDQDGTIRVNGEVVKSIMINGKAFFGNNDPKTLSRNLQADLIDKIQVFNKISENGLDKGETNKYINITIKKNKQDLFSGELSTAFGTLNRFSAKANLSRFRENQQILLIGDGNNTNGIPDINYVGGGGIVRAWNVGANFMEDLNRKTTLNASYSMDDKFKIDEQKSLKQNFISDSILFNDEDSRTNNRDINHGFSLQLEYKPDSLQKFTFSTNNSLSHSSNTFNNNYASNKNSKSINNGIVINNGENNTGALSGGINYEKNFKKKGRSIILNLNYGNGKSKESKFNISRNTYFLETGESRADTLNQHFKIDANSQKTLFYINYTEPVQKNGSLTFFLGTDQTNDSYNKSAFSYNTTNTLYDKYIDSMSNIFRNVSAQYCGRISWYVQKNKLNYMISLSSLSYNFNNKDIHLTNISLHSTILLPLFNLNYSISNNKQIRVQYSKETQFPDITQLQPIPDISDPLNLKLGNPKLKPASSHRFGLSYNTFDAISLRTLYLSIQGNINSDQIINDTKTDSFGRQIIQPFNHSGGYSISFDLNRGLPIKKKANTITIITRSILQSSINYVNGNRNINNKLLASQTISYNSDQMKLFSYALSANINYNYVHYSNVRSSNTNYLNYTISYSGNVNLPLGITISTLLNYSYTSGLTAAYNNNIWILNTSISKTLFQHKQGMITFQGFDLLKQNKSITRNIEVNYIEDIRTNTLAPFFSLKFSYFMGKGKK